jgi:glycerol transport system ATP-binding protein
VTRIVLEDLSFRYPGAAAPTIDGLSLEIASGEAHALLGASGAGKTTLLNLLSGLLEPTEGRILFDERDVSHDSPKARNIAQVFQFPVLYDALSVAQNLGFPLRNFGFSSSEIQARVAYIAEELDLDHILDRAPPDLTLFEKQLVSVGKALARPSVDVVLLDEPLTAVEPRRKWQLRQSLKKVQADLGITMIYVTHDQTEALTFADRVSVLMDAGVLQTASPETIFNAPSHEYVGRFIGSPGMDITPVDALAKVPPDLAPSQRLGLRPAWVTLCDPEEAAVTGRCTAFSVTGTRDGDVVGLATVETPAGTIRVATKGDSATGDIVGVRIKRCVVFDGGELVRSIEF